ncbi:MAG: CRISPR-associated endonuclease Cas1, partial [Schwartzia sp.]|nr:CRISPR-associated endonuclease Cas1 [Schwartzia sp. (in: firmicutes)]
ITTPLLFAFMERNIPVAYIRYDGRLAGTLGSGISIRRLLAQQDAFSHPVIRPLLVREVIRRKMKGQISLLRTYAKRRGVEELTRLADAVCLHQKALERHEGVDELRGLEGIASRITFDGFSYILREPWTWTGRNRRPPKDPVNALLSFGYTMLEKEVRTAIYGARLDPRFGFLHCDDIRRDSLVFDLMEPFRHDVIDRFVLKLLNCHAFRPEDFHKSDGGCWLSGDARRSWYGLYEEEIAAPVERFDGRSPREHIRHEIREFAVYTFGLQKKLGIMSEDDPDGAPAETAESA